MIFKVPVAVLTIAYGVAAYAVTRGADGQLFGSFAAFGCLSLFYGTLLSASRASDAAYEAFWHLIAFECAAHVGMSIDNQLDEMAGMLWLLVPVLVALSIVLGAIIRVAKLM